MTRPSNHAATKETVAERAYGYWEAEGRPEGRDQEHWLRAEAEVLYETKDLKDARTDRAQTPRRQGTNGALPKSDRPDTMGTAARQSVGKAH